jgi:hypothetical protein
MTITYNLYLCVGPITLTLPTASSTTGVIFYVKNVNGSDINIVGNGVELINSENLFTLRYLNSSISLISDGVKWNVF